MANNYNNQNNNDINFVRVGGILTNNLKLYQTRKGTPAVYFTLASHNGQHTDFIDMRAFGQRAVKIVKNASKGSFIIVKASQHTFRHYTSAQQKLINILSKSNMKNLTQYIYREKTVYDLVNSFKIFNNGKVITSNDYEKPKKQIIIQNDSNYHQSKPKKVQNPFAQLDKNKKVTNK